LGTALPLQAQSTPPASPPPPATPAYEAAWKKSLGAAAPILLVADGSMLLGLDTNRALAAFAADDGRELWTVPDVAPDIRLASAPGRVYVITPVQPEHDGQPQKPGRLEALDAKAGRRLWAADFDPGAVDPIVSAQSILLAGDRQIKEYAAGDGSVVWEQSFDAVVTALASSSTHLFVALANQTVRSIDRRTHAVATETHLDAGATTLVLADSRLFVCGEDGSLSAYRPDRSDGFLWRVNRVEPIGRPVVDEHRIYVAQFDNTGRAYDVGNGTERWRLRLESRPLAGVQIAAGSVYFPLLSGALAVASAEARNGQPSSIITFESAEDRRDIRQQWSSLTPDARRLFRLTRPSTHPDWTLTAATRKDVKKSS
jgi:outer membrane protein assembly factor BamB